MKTYSSKTGDRIALRTIDRPNGDIVLQDDITIRLKAGAVRPGVDIWGELTSESDKTTRYLSEIIDDVARTFNERTLELLRTITDAELGSIRETARFVERGVKNVYEELTRLEGWV